MKSLKSKIILPIIAFTFASLPLLSQDLTEKKNYTKLGFNIKEFNDASTREYVGEMLGFETSLAKTIKGDFSAELITEQNWKKIEKDHKLNISNLGFLINYNPENFYFGLGPEISFMTEKYDENKYNTTAFGIAGQIGYEFSFLKNPKLYLQYKYSRLKVEQDGDEKSTGTSSVSLGFKF